MAEVVIGKDEFAARLEANPMWEAIDWRRFLQPGKIAVLVVDAENDCLHEKGKLSRIGWSSWNLARQSGSIDNIKRIVNAAKTIGAPVFWTRAVRQKGYPESLPGTFDEAYVRYLSDKIPGVFEEDSWDVDIIDELKELMGPHDVIIDKPASGAFEGTILERCLNTIGATTLIVTGYFTDFCIESTVRAAFDKGYLNIVPADACDARVLDAHVASLQQMENDFGHVVSTDEIVALMKQLS